MTAWIVGTLVLLALIVIAYRHHDAWWWANHYSKMTGGGSWDRREATTEQVRCTLGSNDPYDHREFVVLKGHKQFETWRKVIEKMLNFGLRQTRTPQRLSLSPIPSDYLILEPRRYFVQDGKSFYEPISVSDLDHYPDIPIVENQQYSH